MRADLTLHKRSEEPWEVEDVAAQDSVNLLGGAGSLWATFTFFDGDWKSQSSISIFFATSKEQILFMHQLRYKVEKAIEQLTAPGEKIRDTSAEEIADTSREGIENG